MGSVTTDGARPGGAVIEELARERLGFEQLRPGQLRAAEALAGGRDVLAVLPTGGGKSAIYELAGMLRAGPTVVVSPLIALQDDQLAHLQAAGLPAIVLNSQQSAGARTAALLASCDPGTFVFLSPEQLTNPETRQALQRARPGLFAVDEAHLISQWGHDFRPDYMLLGAQAGAVGAPVRLALTATAAPPVRQEVVRRLGLRDAVVVIGDFDRPHIHLSVHRARTVSDKRQELVRAAAGFGGPGIVYAATHASAQAARDALAEAGERVTLYHAGLSGRERHDAMTAFLGGAGVRHGAALRGDHVRCCSTSMAPPAVRPHGPRARPTAPRVAASSHQPAGRPSPRAAWTLPTGPDLTSTPGGARYGPGTSGQAHRREQRVGDQVRRGLGQRPAPAAAIAWPRPRPGCPARTPGPGPAADARRPR